MIRKSLGVFVVCASLALAISLAAAGVDTASQSKLSAAAIVDKNVAARGGLQAWRTVQTLSLAGKLGAGGNRRATLPVPVPGPHASAQTAIQVFDGANGWKLRPFLNRRVVEPYTTEEIKAASTQAEIDGFLVDYAAKGTQIELAGMEKVENRDTYKLKLTTKNGQALHVWIDADTFLEAKIEGQPRLLDGTYHAVEVYYRDYRPVNGLQIPYVLETRVLPVARTKMGLRDPAVPPEKIMIEKVVVNPQFDDAMFTKPDAGVAANSK